MKCEECDADAVARMTDVVQGRCRVRHLCMERAEKHFGESMQLTKLDIEKGTISIPMPGGAGEKMQVSLPSEAQEGDVIFLESMLASSPGEHLSGSRGPANEESR